MAPAKTTIASEALETAAGFSGLALDVVRTGTGSGPNTVVSVDLDGVSMYSSFLQFPVMGQLTLGDDIIAMTLFASAPPGTRWSEIEITTGDVLIYGPGTRHMATSPEGIEYRVALIGRSVLDEVADSFETEIHSPEPGSASLLKPSAAVRDLARELARMGSPLAPTDDFPSRRSGVVYGAVNALAADSELGGARRHGVIQNRAIVHECVEYADAVGRGPSIPELCNVAHVSERRLRTAFYNTFDVAPSVFFRARSLSHARDRLLSGDQSVSEVALDVGFQHLGRFASHYADTYGEHPRVTLARARSTAGRWTPRTLARAIPLGPTAPRLGPLPA